MQIVLVAKFSHYNASLNVAGVGVGHSEVSDESYYCQCPEEEVNKPSEETVVQQDASKYHNLYS